MKTLTFRYCGMFPIDNREIQKELRTRLRLLQAATRNLEKRQLSANLLFEIIAETNCPPERAEMFFGNSEDVVLALYAKFAGDLETRVGDLPESSLADRFESLMKIKFELMKPYGEALKGLSRILSNRKSGLGVFSPETEFIRLRVQRIVSAVIAGAKDLSPDSNDELTAALYTAYLGLMWIWQEDETPDKGKAINALRISKKSLSVSAPFLKFSAAKLSLKGLNKFQDYFFSSLDNTEREKAEKILQIIFKRRRLLPSAGVCAQDPCRQCFALHLPKIRYFLKSNRPIHFLLPAFPAKSPNKRKTLGRLPDRAEEEALKYLEKMCREISVWHPPGVRLTVCSDGHVFSDLVGVKDEDVALYGLKIKSIIKEISRDNLIDAFSLPDLYESLDYAEMRRELVEQYAQTIADIRKSAETHPQAASLINGIQRFLFEDRIVLEPDQSRTKIRNLCRDLAYQTVQRSDSWGRLLADCFPAALRLSIHPQDPHSDKIGILLGESNDVWLTPWHGVAVRHEGRFKLMKRYEAEALGAALVEEDGTASYYEL